VTLSVSQKDTTGDGTTVRPECKGASLRAAALRRDQIPYGVPAIVSSAYSFLGKTGNNIADRKLFDLLLMGCNRTLLDRVKQSVKFNGTLLDYNQGHYRLVDLEDTMAKLEQANASRGPTFFNPHAGMGKGQLVAWRPPEGLFGGLMSGASLAEQCQKHRKYLLGPTAVSITLPGPALAPRRKQCTKSGTLMVYLQNCHYNASLFVVVSLHPVNRDVGMGKIPANVCHKQTDVAVQVMCMLALFLMGSAAAAFLVPVAAHAVVRKCKKVMRKKRHQGSG
jgi:hypothetical protein